MKRGELWIERFKNRLRRRGFVIRDITPMDSAAAKQRSRQADRSRIARKRATPSQVQAANSLFPEAPVRTRIVRIGSSMDKA